MFPEASNRMYAVLFMLKTTVSYKRQTDYYILTHQTLGFFTAFVSHTPYFSQFWKDFFLRNQEVIKHWKLQTSGRLPYPITDKGVCPRVCVCVPNRTFPEYGLQRHDLLSALCVTIDLTRGCRRHGDHTVHVTQEVPGDDLGRIVLVHLGQVGYLRRGAEVTP